MLEVLGKKVNDIDHEAALLHDLKKIILEFIHRIEYADFSHQSDVKLLYQKAKEIESQIMNADYKGNAANINRLLAAAEKVKRQPDILIVEIPSCRIVTSGYLNLETDTTHRRFETMWKQLSSQIADHINPHDFMYYDAAQNKLVWMFMLENWMTQADTEGFEIIPFHGGLYAATLADSWEFSEYDRVSKGVHTWLAEQEHLEIDSSPNRHMLYHFAGPHSEQMKNWNYGKIRYFLPVKLKEEQ